MASKEEIQRILNAENIADFHKFSSADGLVSSNPRFMTVVIDISNKCNLKCRMCYFSLDRFFKANPIYVTPDNFEKWAAQLLPHSRTLTLSCGSEPLMSPYFIDILKIASRYKPPHLDFATNGILMTEKISDAMIEYGVTDVMISIDAPTKKTYERIRRGASFERLLKNIGYLTKQKEKKHSATPALRFNVTLMRENIEELEDLVDLAADMKVTNLDFRHMVVLDGLGMDSESLVHHKELTNKYLKKAREKANKLGLSLVSIPKEFGIEKEHHSPQTQIKRIHRLKKYLNMLRYHPKYLLSEGSLRLRNFFIKPRDPKTIYCTLPFTYTLINSGGHVLPCPHCHGIPEFGTVSSKISFDEVWFNDKFRQLRDRILSHDPPEMCKNCSILEMYNISEKNMGKARKN